MAISSNTGRQSGTVIDIYDNNETAAMRIGDAMISEPPQHSRLRRTELGYAPDAFGAEVRDPDNRIPVTHLARIDAN